MLRRLWLSLRRDNLINWRNYFYLVVVLVALIYTATVMWVVPANTDIAPDVYVADLTADGKFAAYVRQVEAAVPGNKAHLAASAEELRQRVQGSQNSLGVVLEDAGAALPKTTLYFQGHENDKVRNLLAVALEGELRQLYGQPYADEVAVREQTLGVRASGEKVPFNLSLVPLFLFADPAMIGLLFIVALVFMEKEAGTLRAYMVTPGRVWEYLLSKALTLSLLAVLFTLILAPITLGGRPNYLHLLGVMVLGSILGTLVGAWLAVYFQSLSQALMPAVGVMVLLGLPAVALWVPSFSPVWLQWLPTYPLVFGLREAALPTGNGQIVYNAMLYLAALDVLLLALASWAFNRQMAHS